MKTKPTTSIIILCFLVFTGLTAFGQEGGHGETEEKFNASSFIMEHLADSHEWHLWTKKNGESVAIYLPVILYSKDKGFDMFSSKKIAHGHEYNGYTLEEGVIVSVDEAGNVNTPLDMSITKTVLGVFFSCFVGLLLFIGLSRSYKKTGISHPRGIQSFLEPIILFVRDDIAISNIGKNKYEKFMPYLLTAFFFILINNIMGLIPFPPPFGANVTGNIAVTMVLALFTFVITQISGNKRYWHHIIAAPGVPLWLLPIMIPVEIIGLFSKPFALMVRLFANIMAGHIIVLSLVALIFIFKSLAIAPVSAIFVVFMDCLELFVAFLQAYVFTLLSALFIGLAVEEEHH
ncbi:MAG: F0F1 ATP synthase subunit A [Bacteroidales bacterium]|nr:F0F1 ATP synthase subunit A [Bacteroidales bacterium]